MIERPRVASRRPQVLLAQWIVAWHVASLQVEGVPSEAAAAAGTGEAWKWIDPLS